MVGFVVVVLTEVQHGVVREEVVAITEEYVAVISVTKEELTIDVVDADTEIK